MWRLTAGLLVETPVALRSLSAHLVSGPLVLITLLGICWAPLQGTPFVHTVEQLPTLSTGGDPPDPERETFSVNEMVDFEVNLATRPCVTCVSAASNRFASASHSTAHLTSSHSAAGESQGDFLEVLTADASAGSDPDFQPLLLYPTFLSTSQAPYRATTSGGIASRARASHLFDSTGSFPANGERGAVPATAVTTPGLALIPLALAVLFAAGLAASGLRKELRRRRRLR